MVGDKLKKLFIIVLMLLFFVNSNFVSADDFEIDYSKVIIRQVVTKIVWDDFNECIVVYKILIQKDKANSIQTSPTESEIYVESFEGKTLTDMQAEEFVRKYSTEVFNSDLIFGHTVKVFKDLSGDHNVSQDEIDKWVKLAQQQVEKDYLSPPKFKDSGSAWNKIFSYLIFVVMALILFIFIAGAVRFLRKK